MTLDYFEWQWVGINILVPVVGPLFVLWLFSLPTNLATMTKNIVIKAIGKGELFWAVMGMAASTCYDLDAYKSIAINPKAVTWATVAWNCHLVLILCASIMVSLNSMEVPPPPVGTPPPPPPANPNIPSPGIFISSIIFTVVVAIFYTAVHTTLTEEESKVHKAAIIKAQECIAKANQDAKHCLEGIK